MAVIRGRHRYLARSRFATYLFAIAHRRTQDRWRGLARRAETPLSLQPPMFAAAGDNPAESAVRSSMEQALTAALRSLAPEQREAFLLRAEGDLSVADIALVMGSSHETTKSRLRYAYRHLRLRLEAWRQ
jgi:RNA polymerase sigma-70 factor, ECF subfamily